VADRYLLESGAPDGYLLEDSSGVLLLEEEAAPVLPLQQDSSSTQVQIRRYPSLAVLAATAGVIAGPLSSIPADSLAWQPGQGAQVLQRTGQYQAIAAPPPFIAPAAEVFLDQWATDSPYPVRVHLSADGMTTQPDVFHLVGVEEWTVRPVQAPRKKAQAPPQHTIIQQQAQEELVSVASWANTPVQIGRRLTLDGEVLWPLPEVSAAAPPVPIDMWLVWPVQRQLRRLYNQLPDRAEWDNGVFVPIPPEPEPEPEPPAPPRAEKPFGVSIRHTGWPRGGFRTKIFVDRK